MEYLHTCFIYAMNLLCYLLKQFFNNILSTAIFPDIWKLANVTPIFKKGDKQLINNYRLISILPICGKMLEKIIFNNLYKYFTTNPLITKNSQGSDLVIPPQTN